MTRAEKAVEAMILQAAETDPAVEVPEGLWVFTDKELRSLLAGAIEMYLDLKPQEEGCEACGMHWEACCCPFVDPFTNEVSQ